MKKSKIIIISILTSILLLGGIFAFAYFTFFYNVKGSEIVLENVKFQVNDSPNKGEEDVVYFTTDDLTQGDGYQINLNYSLNGNFVSNYAMKYKTFFEVTDTNNISTAIDVYRFYDDNYHYVDKLSNLIYDESDENGSSIYTDFLGVTGTHCEKFLLVYSMGSTIEDKNSFNLKISTKSEMVTTTSAEFPYFYLNDMGSSGDDNSNAETAESILKQLPSNDLIYGRTIVLMRDITYTTPTNITFENLVGIDLNGHKLNLAGGSLVFKDTNESASVNYNNKIGIYDSVGTGSFDNTKVTINYTKSVIDIDSNFYNNSDTKLINGSTFTISKISMDAFGSAAKEKFAYITQSKHTVNNGSYTFDLFGNLKYYLLSNSLSMDTNNIAVSSARGEAEATLNADKTITVSNITNSDSISLTLTASGFDTQAQINDILQLYGSTTDSCKEYLESYIPKKLDGSIYLPSYISTFNSYITWISYDENLINKNGMVLPNGYFNLDNWVSQRTNLGFIIDQSGEQMSGVIKDIEITVLTVEERVELLFDPISVTFNNDDSTTYNFDAIEMLYKKYDSTNLAEIASTYFNITIDTSLSDEAQREAFIAALTNKIGLTKVVVSNNQEPAFVEETISQAQDTLVQGVTNLTQSGVPNEVVSLVYTLTYSFTDGSIEKYKLFNVNIGEAAVTLVDLTNSLRVPFDTYSKYMTDYEVVDEVVDGVVNRYNRYNTYSNRFQLVSKFDGISIDYTVSPENSNYVRLETDANGNKYITIIKDNVPSDTHTVTVTAKIQGVEHPIYLPFTCVGVLHGTTSRNHAEFENGNLYTIMLNNYDTNGDLILTDLEAKNSTKTSLTIKDRSIQSLVGLKYFTKLTSISITNSKLSNIGDLAYLTNLTYVNLSTNQISSIEAFRYLDNLKTLYLSSNQISSIEPIQYLKGLEKLDVANNNISNFKYIENLVGLTELKVYKNTISNGQIVVSLENASSQGQYNHIIRGNQYYFNLLSQKVTDLGKTLNLYVKNDGKLDSYATPNAKLEADILSQIVPISQTSNTIALPTYINYNGTQYEITYTTNSNYENYIVISGVNSHITNVTLNQIPVNNEVTIYASVIGLAENEYSFYRPLTFDIRKGYDTTANYGEIEVESGHWMKAELVVPDLRLLSNLWVKYDANNDGKITNSELNTSSNITINVDSCNVKSLNGIQYFKNIKTLNIRNNILELNDDGYAMIEYIKYLNNLNTLYMNGQKFNFDDLLYYVRLKDNNTFATSTTKTFNLVDIDGNDFTVTLNSGLTSLTNLYVAGSTNLSDYEMKTYLYHVYLNNPSVSIYKDSNNATWNPISEEINKFIGSMTTTANFINYNDKVEIKKSYDFYMYDDLYPTTFSLTNGTISDQEYVFAGGSTGEDPTKDAYKNIFHGYNLGEDGLYVLSAVDYSKNTDSGFISKKNHKLKDYFNINTDSTNINITYKKLIYKDYQAYLSMTLKTTSLCNGRKTVNNSVNYYLTLFMQYNNDYVFVDDEGIDSSVDNKPINSIFGAVETMLFVMNGISEELRTSERSNNYTITHNDGTVDEVTNDNANYIVKSSETKKYTGKYNTLESCDFDKYFFIHGNFMPTATSAVDGLRFLPQIKKLYIRRDAVLGTGIDLRNIEELFAVYTFFDISKFQYVCSNMKIIILAQATSTNLSEETSLDSNPNKLVETYMVYFPNLIEFYFSGEGSGDKGQMYEWSAFLAYSYIPYNQVFKKDSNNNYVYYHTENGNEYVGGVKLDYDRLYYWYDEADTAYENFKNVFYSTDGSTFAYLTQSVIDNNSNILDTSNGKYTYLYVDDYSGDKISSSNQIFRKVEEGTVYLNNFKTRNTGTGSTNANLYSNTYEQQVMLIALYNNLIDKTKYHFYTKPNTNPSAGNSTDFDPTFSIVVYDTDVTKEYNELAPSISDLHVKFESGYTFDGTDVSSMEYKDLEWVDTDYTDYFRKGLKVNLPIKFEDYKIGYAEYDNKYRDFTITWYVSYATSNTAADSTDYQTRQINNGSNLTDNTFNALSGLIISNGNIEFTLNESGYYVFEGLLGLSDGTNSYAFNTKYDCKPASLINNLASNTYSYNVSGSVSFIYPITITTMDSSTIDSLSESRKSMTLISKDTITIDYGNNSMSNEHHLKWFDTIIDRSFKFVTFASFAKTGIAQSADITIDLMYTQTDPMNVSADRLKLYDKILNRLYNIASQNDSTFNYSNINKGLDNSDKSYFDIKTFYGLQRFLSDIYTFEGWETLNLTTLNYKYASNITYLPDKFPYKLTTLNLSSTYGITYFGGLFDSNVTSAKLSYGNIKSIDAGIIDNAVAVNKTYVRYYTYSSDTVMDLFDYTNLYNSIYDSTVSEIDLKLTTLYVNQLTEDSFKVLADLSNKLKEKLTITIYPGATDNFLLSFYDYGKIKYFYDNIDSSKLDIILNGKNLVTDVLQYIIADYDKVTAPDILTNSAFYKTTGSLSSGITVVVPSGKNYSDGEIKLDTSDFYPTLDLGGNITYNVAIRWTNSNMKVQVFKKLEADSVDNEPDKVYGVKIGVFNDGIKIGVNDSVLTYDESKLKTYDSSNFDYNLINSLLFYINNSSYALDKTIGEKKLRCVRGPQLLEYLEGEDCSPKITKFEGYQYILDKNLLVDGKENGDKYYLIIVNTEWLNLDVYSNGNIFGLRSEHYDTIDVKGFEYLPIKAISEGNGVNSKGSNCVIHRIKNSSNTIDTTDGIIKLQYIEINNLNFSQDYGVTSSQGAEANIATFTTIFDVKNLAKSMADNSTLVIGNRAKILQRFLKIDGNKVLLVNDENKTIYVKLDYAKMHLLFNNGDIDTSFNYQKLKNEILNATIGEDTIFLKDYNDFYSPAFYKLLNFAGGELTNITQHNNVMNHPFYSAETGVLRDDSVYNYYISDNAGISNAARIIYSSELYDISKIFGITANIHSNNIRTMSNNKTLSMYYNDSDLLELNDLNNKVFNLTSSSKIVLPKTINGKNVIYLPVDTWHVYKELIHYFESKFKDSNSADINNFKNLSYIPWTYFDQNQGFINPIDYFSNSFKFDYLDLFSITETKNTYEISLKGTGVTSSYTATRYKFVAFEFKGTVNSSDTTVNKEIYQWYHDNLKFNNWSIYDFSFNINKAKDWIIDETVFYVDVNTNSSIGRQVIKIDDPLVLPKYITINGVKLDIEYDLNDNDMMELEDNGDYYYLKCTDEAMNIDNQLVRAYLKSDTGETTVDFLKSTYSSKSKKYSEMTEEQRRYVFTRNNNSGDYHVGNYWYSRVENPDNGTKYYYLTNIAYKSIYEELKTIDFYVDLAPGVRLEPSNNYSKLSSDYYVEVLVESSTGNIIPASKYIITGETNAGTQREGNTITSTYNSDYVDSNGNPNSGYEFRIISGNEIFESGLLLTDMFYGGAISFGNNTFLRHDQCTNDIGNVDYFPKYVVMDSNGNFVKNNGEIITYPNTDRTSAETYVSNNANTHLAMIYTKDQIKNIHYFSNTVYKDSKVDFRAQSALTGLEIFPLTHVRLGYYSSTDYGYASDANSRAFPGNNFECFKDMELVEFDLVFKHTSIFVSDWSFLFNSRESLLYFMYGGTRTNQDETYGTTHDDFSFLLSFNNVKDIRLYGLPGIEKTQSFRYFVSVMNLLHNGTNIIHYYNKDNSGTGNPSDYTNIYADIPADLNSAVTILSQFETTDLSDFNYQNGYELYYGNNDSYFSSIRNYDSSDSTTQYLLPSFINDNGTYYKLTYDSLSNFAEIVAINNTSNSPALSMLQYQELYSQFVNDCLENGIEVDDYEFVKNYKIYARFKNLENCLTNRIMVSVRIESQSKMISKNEILDIDLSSDTLKNNYKVDYYDGNQYIYTPYSYERFLSIYVDHTAII